MFLEDLEIKLMLLWGCGFVVALASSWLAYRLVTHVAPQRWRQPWWAVAGVVAVCFIVVMLVDQSARVSHARDDLESQVGLPVTYRTEGSTLTLTSDGAAELTDVVLAEAVTKNGSGRWCISGETRALTGSGRWSLDASGSVRLEMDGRVAQLFPDPKLIQGYGWQKTYLTTGCDEDLATMYLASTVE